MIRSEGVLVIKSEAVRGSAVGCIAWLDVERGDIVCAHDLVRLRFFRLRRCCTSSKKNAIVISAKPMNPRFHQIQEW